MIFQSCKKTEKTTSIKQFFLVSIEAETICSAKGNLSDTLYFENRNPDKSIEYSYCILTAKEKQKFRKVLWHFEKQKPIENFKTAKEETIIIIQSDLLKFHKLDWGLENGKTIHKLIKNMRYKCHEIDTIKRFWDTNNFVPSIREDKLIKTIANSNVH